jgi:hypothetical protein
MAESGYGCDAAPVRLGLVADGEVACGAGAAACGAGGVSAGAGCGLVRRHAVKLAWVHRACTAEGCVVSPVLSARCPARVDAPGFYDLWSGRVVDESELEVLTREEMGERLASLTQPTASRQTEPTPPADAPREAKPTRPAETAQEAHPTRPAQAAGETKPTRPAQAAAPLAEAERLVELERSVEGASIRTQVPERRLHAHSGEHR